VNKVDPVLPAPDWPDAIFAALKAAQIRQVGYVPDAGHARLIELCRADPEIRAVVLTSEEEGIGLAAGAWLGGTRAALLMQSSGVGNCINNAVASEILPVSLRHASSPAMLTTGTTATARQDASIATAMAR
jgi:sulfopyruvate decarboxylase TPP-binding subunit